MPNSQPLGRDPEKEAMKRLNSQYLKPIKDTADELEDAKYLQKSKLDVFKSTLELQITGQLPDLTSQQESGEFDNRQKKNALSPDTLNGRRSKDDIGVRYGLDSLKGEIIDKPTTDQLRRGFYDISRVLDIDERLYKTNKKLDNDYMESKGVDPREFRDVSKKLYKCLKASIESGSEWVSRTDFEIASEKFRRMVKKLGM